MQPACLPTYPPASELVRKSVPTMREVGVGGRQELSKHFTSCGGGLRHIPPTRQALQSTLPKRVLP